MRSRALSAAGGGAIVGTNAAGRGGDESRGEVSCRVGEGERRARDSLSSNMPVPTGCERHHRTCKQSRKRPVSVRYFAQCKKLRKRVGRTRSCKTEYSRESWLKL